MSIPESDRGLLLGDGLFETLLARDGVAQDWDAHWRRLVEGCAALDLPAPDEAAACAAAGSALAAVPTGTAALRLTWTAGNGGRGLDRPAILSPRLLAVAVSYAPSAEPVRLATVKVRRNEGSPASRLKTLGAVDSVLARAAARRVGAEEGLMLNNGGEVACAAAANLFWLRRDRLLTPALDCGVLAGTMRARVLEAAAQLGLAPAEVRAQRADLDAAEAVLLSNSLIGVRAVRDLDGRVFAADPRVEALAAAVGVSRS